MTLRFPSRALVVFPVLLALVSCNNSQDQTPSAPPASAASRADGRARSTGTARQAEDHQARRPAALHLPRYRQRGGPGHLRRRVRAVRREGARRHRKRSQRLRHRGQEHAEGPEGDTAHAGFARRQERRCAGAHSGTARDRGQAGPENHDGPAGRGAARRDEADEPDQPVRSLAARFSGCLSESAA